MNNNDILIRIRYAFDIKETDVVKIFQMGGMEFSKEEIQKMLIKPKDEGYKKDTRTGTYFQSDDTEESTESSKKDDIYRCNNRMLEAFLEGFIIFNRGVKKVDPSEPESSQKTSHAVINNTNVNNVVLKKLKIALSLSSEDMLAIFEEAGASLSKGELSALFRKEGHRNYKEAQDSNIKFFLKGLALRHRK